MDLPQDQLDAILNDPLAAAEQLDNLTGGEKGTEGEIAAEPPAADPEAAKTEPQAAAEPKKDDAATEADPEKSVILTKDGKHQIPYSVLQRERERANTLEAQLRETIAKQASLEAQAKSGKPDEVADVPRLSAEELADLESEAPTLAKAFKALYARIDTLESSHRQVAEHQAQAARSTVDEAIDAVPKLAFVKQNDVEAFNRIAKFDMELRVDPKWIGRPMQDRFAAAVRMYEAAYGEINAPTASGTVDPAKEAQAVIDKAAATALPNTLTDIPGGQPPPKDALEAIGQKSAASLTEMFMGMSEEQINSYLARL